MNTKSLSSRQVRWVQKLSHYPFQINYRQDMANETTNVLSQYPQWSVEEEETLRAENVKILHYLHSSLINASLSSLALSEPNISEPNLALLYQVLICGTHVLPQLNQFLDFLWSDTAQDGLSASIGYMNLRLPKL